MKNDRPGTMDGDLERLIDAEVGRALDTFRAGDFEADIRRRIRERGGREGAPARPRALQVTAWVATAAILLAGGMILLTHVRRTPRAGLGVAIETVLRRAPGSLILEWEASRFPRAAEETSRPMNGQILTALMKAHHSSASISLPDKAGASPGTGRRLRPMTLEETYRILFIDRSIERVLALTS